MQDSLFSKSYYCIVNIFFLYPARDASQREIEKAFERFGKVSEVWLAKNPPCFAFIVFKYKDEAEDAVREMNGV